MRMQVASIFFGSDLVSRVFRHTLATRAEQAKAPEVPETATLDAAIRDQLTAALPTVAEQVAGQLQADLDAVRDRVQQLTAAGQTDTAARDRAATELDAVRGQLGDLDSRLRDQRDQSKLDERVRDQLADALPEVRREVHRSVTAELDALRDQVTHQAATAAAAQVQDSVGELRETVAEELAALRDQAAAAATVQLNGHRQPRELQGRAQTGRSGRADPELTDALEAAYATNPNPRAWTKATLADAVTARIGRCSPTRAYTFLKGKEHDRTTATAHDSATVTGAQADTRPVADMPAATRDGDRDRDWLAARPRPVTDVREVSA